jgi:hypothetical protein
MLILQENESYNFDSVHHELRIVWHLLLYFALSVRDGRRAFGKQADPAMS